MNNLSVWDYETSVKTMKVMVLNWRSLTVEMVSKLYDARKELGKQGERNDLVANATKFNWTSYCTDIGIDRSTAHRWLERFIPEENRLLTVEELETKKQQDERSKQETNKNEYQKATLRVSEYRKTKIKPSGWGDREESILKDEIDREARIKKAQSDMQEELKRKSEERIRESEGNSQSSKINFDELNIMASELVENMNKRRSFKESIRVSHEGKDDPFVDAIMDYLDTLSDDSRRIEACHNIIKVCKGIANQLQLEK